MKPRLSILSLMTLVVLFALCCAAAYPDGLWAGIFLSSPSARSPPGSSARCSAAIGPGGGGPDGGLWLRVTFHRVRPRSGVQRRQHSPIADDGPVRADPRQQDSLTRGQGWAHRFLSHRRAHDRADQGRFSRESPRTDVRPEPDCLFRRPRNQPASAPAHSALLRRHRLRSPGSVGRPRHLKS